LARFVAWRGIDEWLAEAASIDLTDDGIAAIGTQLGAEPLPYRLDYRLDASEGFVTRELELDASGDGWSRHLELIHDGNGSWRYDADREGDAPFGDPGGDTDALREALDCDLAFSPLTNLMPVRRNSLHDREGETEILVAWVSVPDLGFHAAPQRYEHVRAEEHGSVVRFVSLDGEFRSDLRLDPAGLVIEYPQLARRVDASERA
jgi:hypothetical protein